MKSDTTNKIISKDTSNLENIDFKNMHNYEITAMLEQIANNSTPPTEIFKSRFSPIIFIAGFLILLSILAWMYLSYNNNQDAVYVYSSSDSELSTENNNSQSKLSTSSSSKASSPKTSSSKKPSSLKASSNKMQSSKASSSSSKTSQPSEQIVVSPDSSYKPFNTIGNSSSNVQNGSFMSMQGDWIYYINSQDGNSLYKMRRSGAENQKVSDLAISSVSLIGESTFVTPLGRNNTVQDILWDGSGSKSFSIGCNSVSTFSDFMITSDIYGIYKLNFNAGAKEKLHSGSVSHCCCENSRVYFIESGSLCSFSIQNPRDFRIEVSSPIQCYAVSPYGIYYCSNNLLYSSQNPNQPLFNINTSCINITDGVLYYSNLSDSGKLYSINLDGSNITCLSNISADSICVCGDWVAIKSGGEIVLI